jgi:hypothetical protein
MDGLSRVGTIVAIRLTLGYRFANIDLARHRGGDKGSAEFLEAADGFAYLHH